MRPVVSVPGEQPDACCAHTEAEEAAGCGEHRRLDQDFHDDMAAGKFNSFFTRNIASDFGGAGRNSGYLMVTGAVNMPRGANNYQFAESIVYVAEAGTGQVAAYTIPWNSSMQAANKTQYGEFQPLDVQQFRTAFVRDQPKPADQK